MKEGLCVGCGGRLGPTVVEGLGKMYHNPSHTVAVMCTLLSLLLRWHPSCYNNSAAPPRALEQRCAGCGGGLGRSVVKALGQTWHESCFVCAGCGSELGGDFLTKDGKPFHEDCYNSAFGVRCKRKKPNSNSETLPSPRLSIVDQGGIR